METWQKYYSRAGFANFGSEYFEFRKARAPIEAGFAIEKLGLKAGQRLLDLCCGLGHNAVHFAKSGLNVVGVDASEPSIEAARTHVQGSGVNADFQLRDARDLPWQSEFDAVVMLFNSFGYCEKREDNWLILKNFAAALKPGGGFLIEVLSRDFALAKAKLGAEEFPAARDQIQRVRYEFDESSDTFHLHRHFLAASGESVAKLHFAQKACRTEDVTAALHVHGLDVQETYGGYSGEAFTPESSSFILVGVKKI